MKTNREDEFQNLGSACAELLEHAFMPDQFEFQHAVRVARELLHAEHCSVFDVEITGKDPKKHKFYLRLRAEDLEKPRGPKAVSLKSKDKRTKKPVRNLRIPIRKKKYRGLTGSLAYDAKPVRMNLKDLQANIYRTGRKPSHIEKCVSIIGIPLLDRKDNLIGFLKVENKLAANGKKRARPPEFSKEDFEQAGIFGKLFSSVLELRRTVQIFRDLVKDMSQAEELETTYQTLLSKAKSLLLADRGDLVIWDAQEEALKVKAIVESHSIFPSARNEAIEKSSRVPHPDNLNHNLPAGSLAGALWEDKKPNPYRIYKDITAATKPFVCADSRVRSEIAIILELQPGRQKMGVLNLESFQPDYFSERDAELLRRFAPYAAVILNFGEKRRDEITELEKAKGEYQNLLENVSEGVCRTTEDGMYQVVNSAMAEIYGVPRESFYSESNKSGRKAADFYVRPELRNELIEKVRISGTVKDFEFEAYYGESQKTKIFVRQNVRVGQDSEGRQVYDATLVDTTKEKQRKHQLESALRVCAPFAAASATVHDLKEPVTQALRVLDQIEKKYPNDWTKEKVNDIHNRMIKFYRAVDLMRGDVRFEDVDIIKLINEAAVDAWSEGNSGIERPKFSKEMIRGNARLIWGVFHNIFANGKRLNIGRMWVKVQADAAQNTVNIQIEDNGPGFGEDFLNDPLSFGPEKTNRGFIHAVLIIQYLHEGKIEFGKSTHHKGAKIEIQLPIPK